MTEERIPRPEEVLEDPEGLTPEQKPRPLRCRAGSATDDPCPRDATTWMHPEGRDYPLCDEHARAIELGKEASDRGLVEEITGDWLRIARVWGLGELEQLAINAHDRAKEAALKAEARAELAAEMADAPRAKPGNEGPVLTREQDEELLRLIRRSDGLVNAYTTIEDIPEGQIEEDVRRRTLAVLAEAHEAAEKECGRYKAELGLPTE